MTELKKPIRRKTALDEGRIPLTVTLYPNGFFGFRLKGARREYTIPVMTAFRYAVQAEKAARIAERKEAKRKQRCPFRLNANSKRKEGR